MIQQPVLEETQCGEAYKDSAQSQGADDEESGADDRT